MILSHKDLTRNELIGLNIFVSGSSNPSQKGIKGIVIDETKNTLVVSNGHRGRRLQKSGLILQFTLPDSSRVKVNGEEILGRPVDRVKRYGRRRRNEKRRT